MSPPVPAPCPSDSCLAEDHLDDDGVCGGIEQPRKTLVLGAARHVLDQRIAPPPSIFSLPRSMADAKDNHIVVFDAVSQRIWPDNRKLVSAPADRAASMRE
jgi:hypothetical protein